MALINITSKEQFEKEIKEGTVFVDFKAEWCGPCKMMMPVIEEMSQTRTDVKFLLVDVDQNRDIAEEFMIMSIPTSIAFKNGQQTNKNIGFAPKNKIEELLK